MAALTITQGDIEDVWGSRFVAQWSQTGTVSQNPTADATRIAAAIRQGVRRVNFLLCVSPYAQPLEAVTPADPPAEVVDAMAVYAGYWLFRTSGQQYTKDTLRWVEDLVKRTEDTLRMLRTGSVLTDLVLNTNRRQTPQVIG